MCIETQQNDKILVVTLTEKRLDAASALQFKEKMKKIIQEGNLQIVMDLTNVSFMDSSGLSAIVSSAKLLSKQGIMVFCGVKGVVASLFELTHIDRVFSVYPNLEEALRAQK